MKKNCDNCAHKEDESKDPNGNRIVRCDANEFQLFFPFADECVHWEKAVESDEEWLA